MSRVLRKLARVTELGLAVFGAFAVLLSAWLMSGRSTGLVLDRFVVESDVPQRASAIVCIAGGGGTERVSEAEVYAEAARWLGSPPEAIVLDPLPGSTAEHPRNLLKLERGDIRTDTPLLVVTSRLHSKRTALCFRKAGFTNFRMVTAYEAQRSPLARSQRHSVFPSFKPTGKNYGDPLNRLRWGLNDLLVAIRELLAIGVYRYRGEA